MCIDVVCVVDFVDSRCKIFSDKFVDFNRRKRGNYW